MSAPILVAGGGIAALTAVIVGARRGLDVRVFEQAPALRTGGGALVLWSNAMAVLAQAGVDQRVLSAGTRITSATFQTTAAKRLQELPIGALCTEIGLPTVVIPRRALMQILYSAVDRARVAFGRKLMRFEERGGVVEAHCEDGSSISGRALIGADGLRSVVRQQLHGAHPPRRAEQAAWVGIADLEHPSLPHGRMVGTLGHGQRFWATQVEPGRTYWYAIIREPESEGPKRVSSKLELLRAYDGWHEPIQELIRVTPSEEIITTDICDRPPLAGDWGLGRVTLLGDAAHPLTPDLGQGACQAIEGAAVLCACLVDDPDVPRALRRYEAKRRTRTAMLTELCRVIATDSMSVRPDASLRRDLVLRFTPTPLPMGILRRVIHQPPPP